MAEPRATVVSVYKTKLELWFCQKCVTEFETERLLDEHILSVHEKLPEEIEDAGIAEPVASSSRSPRIFTCEECRDTFNSSFVYYKHVATDHRNEVTTPEENVEVARTTPKQKRKITCKACNKIFTSSYLYYKHVAEEHHIREVEREQTNKKKKSVAKRITKDQPKEDKPPEQIKNKKKSAVKKLPKDQPKEDKPSTQTSPRPPTKFTCKICGSNFALAYLYYKHINIAHGNAKSTAKVANTSRPRRNSTSKPGSEKHTCKICQCRLKTRLQYYKHLATAHENQNTYDSLMSPTLNEVSSNLYQMAPPSHRS